MSRTLCISVTLLDPHFHGRVDRNAPEWPPSPMRLFQALVAGACAGGRRLPDAEVAAFRWLERRDAPAIVAPRASATNGHKLFVPNNDGDKEPDRQKRLTEKPVRPHRIAEEGVIHYLWPIPDDEWPGAEAHAVALCQEARRLLSLGWGIDMAFADGRVVPAADSAELRGILWNPWPHENSSGGRIPIRGTFDDLERAHQSFLASTDPVQNLYRPPSKPRVFGKAAYLSADSLPPRHYAAFRLESTGGDERGPAFPQAKVAHVAAMLRSRACAAAQDDPHWQGVDAATYVAGHAGEAQESIARFSYLPLPTVGHQHADGMIRRVLIAQPHGASDDHWRWALSRLNHTALIAEETQKPCAVLSAIRENDNVLDCYVESAEGWFSVTPVVLPGMDDGKQVKAEKLVLKAIAQAGLDIASIAEISLQKAPIRKCSLHPKQFQRFLPKHLSHLPRWHVVLRFRQPIAGPLAVGAGRHCGLGLFTHN